jgi:hypothetical protein
MQQLKPLNSQQMNYQPEKKFRELSDNRNKLGILNSVCIRLWNRNLLFKLRNFNYFDMSKLATFIRISTFN